ncbi:SDR family NAD(P)-dependent oxidoreductase, partial [Pseudomonadota bacterium]
MDKREQLIKLIAARKKGMRGVAGKLVDAYDNTASNNNSAVKESSLSEPFIHADSNDIAIIGLDCRFPGASSSIEFWNNLCTADCAIAEAPTSRWDPTDYYSSDQNAADKSHSRWAGLIDDIECFDAEFFQISPMEAELMDPQQRIFLQTAWHALEDAAYSRTMLENNRCGVYVGASFSDYGRLLLAAGFETRAQAFTGLAPSILSARISYLLNLRGPSLTVDTACSSSTVAIRLACQALIEGECDMALAGGVTLMVTPETQVRCAKAGILSASGKCRSFADDADGIVVSEGVGAIVLKPLGKAISDGDPIYCTVKGIGLNQDGKTNGITAPSANSQAQLELDVYRKAGIDPSQISAVEAHGTGTPLGDPIEIKALTHSFGHYTQQKQFCALGSVKSNIGHTAMAAGIASVIKMALSFKHEMLPATLHANETNKRIDFSNSPFYINSALKPWPSSREKPRMAAVSSFGFSGTNAHLVLGEAPLRKSKESALAGPCLWMFSAKSFMALQQQLTCFGDYIRGDGFDCRPQDIAYTLWAGRNHYDHRVALVINDMESAEETLRQASKQISIGITQHRSEQNSLLASAQASLLQITKMQAVSESHCRSLADLYTYFGLGDLPWHELFERQHGERIGIPGYVFAKDRYWVPGSENLCGRLHSKEIKGNTQYPTIYDTQPVVPSTAVSSKEHLVEVAELTGDEFFLRDHRVNKQSIVPGVRYLEWACKAAGRITNNQVTTLQDVIWLRPLSIGTAMTRVSVKLSLDNVERIPFTVESLQSNEEALVHVEGVLLTAEALVREEGGHIALEEIRARCQHSWDKRQCYDLFDQYGMEYGPSHQGITELFFNDVETLAQLCVPSHVSNDTFAYGLHPALLDSALQSVVILLVRQLQGELTTYLPYSIDSVNLYHRLPMRCFAYTKVSSNAGSDKSYDIQLVDMAGMILADIRGFSLRSINLVPLPNNSKSVSVTNRGQRLLHYYQRRWQAAVLNPVERTTDIGNGCVVIMTRHSEFCNEFMKVMSGHKCPLIVVSEGADYRVVNKHQFVMNPNDASHYKQLLAALLAEHKTIDCVVDYRDISRSSEVGPIIDPTTLPSSSFESHSLSTLFSESEELFRHIFLMAQALMVSKLSTKVRMVLACSYTGKSWESCPYDALPALFRTIRRENPLIQCQYVHIDDRQSDIARAVNIVVNEITHKGPYPIEVRIVDSERQVSVLKQIQLPMDSANFSPVESVFKVSGSYLISGGAGGIGSIIARYLARYYKARLILVGRSERNVRIDSLLNELQALGSEAVYHQIDIDDTAQIQRELNYILAPVRNAPRVELNGVIHCAGVTQDQFIIKQSAGAISNILKPKLQGAINLHHATANQPLDFFLLSSSIAAVFGNPGQAEYSYANNMQSYFSQMREVLRNKGRCSGRTVCLHWPLWENGGMGVDSGTMSEFRNRYGIEPLSDADGMKVLERCLVSDEPELVIMHSDIDKFDSILASSFYNQESIENPAKRDTITEVKSGSPIPEDSIGYPVGKSNLRHIAIDYLQRCFARNTKIPISKIFSAIPLETYGVDSVMILSIIRQLENDFGVLSKTLLFEYQTIDALADYFIDHHASTLQQVSDGVMASSLAHPSKTVTSPLTHSLSSVDEFIEHRDSPPSGSLPTTPSESLISPLDKIAMRSFAIEYLQACIAKSTKQPLSKLFPTMPFETYGVDSMMTLSIIRELETDFDELPKTLLFEYQTIDALANYLVESHADIVRRLIDTVTESALITPIEKISLERPDSKEESGKMDKDLSLFGVPQNTTEHANDIAIIGISGRYPDAENIDEFWENLSSGRDSISEIPAQRWDNQEYSSVENGNYGKWGGFMKDIDKFDPALFKISPREAVLMDPQERIFLETVWQLLEDAGYSQQALYESTVGVYVGVMYGEYQLFGGVNSKNSTAISSSFASVANRVSYCFDFHGPSLALDTMCSSSLTSIHLACESIRRGESDYGIAGGINLSLHPNKYLLLSQHKFLSSDGRCRSFGDGGDGYVPGEGAGAVMLKSYNKAKADGDRIHAVIKASAINHGGKTNGYSVPNPKAQSSLIASAWRNSGIDPTSIGYLEAHGTGTALGDPIEFNALTDAFSSVKLNLGSIPIGSVKSNIGHLEAAAGIAGITKLVLQLKKRQLVPSLHAVQLNPLINFDKSPFFINTKLSPWPSLNEDIDGVAVARLRRTAISSFGAGGSNAHVILEEAPAVEQTTMVSQYSGPQIIILSAKGLEPLKESVRNLIDFLRDSSLGSSRDEVVNSIPNSLANIAYTLQVGRTALEERIAIVAESEQLLYSELENWLDRGCKPEAGIDITRCWHANIYSGNAMLPAQDDLDFHDLSALAQAWVSGRDIQWRLVHAPALPRLVKLPGYPMVRKSYWHNGTFSKSSGELHPNNVFSRPETTQTGISQQETLSSIGPIDLSAVRGVSHGPIVLAPVGGTMTHRVNTVQIETNSDESSKRKFTSTDAKLKQLAEIQHYIKGKLADVLFLELEDIVGKQPLVDMGLDSVLGVELIQSLNQHYNLNFKASQLYDTVTLDQLSKHINASLPEGMIVEEDVRVENIGEISVFTHSQIAAEASDCMDNGVHRNISEIPNVKNVLIEQLASALFLTPEEINQRMPFVDLGLDSVVGVEWTAQINRAFQLDIKASKLYDHTNLESLSGYVEDLLQKKTVAPILHAIDSSSAQSKTTPSAQASSQSEEDQQITDQRQGADNVTNVLREQLASALFLVPDEINERVAFVDLGLDSVVGVEWIARINKAFQLDVKASKLYDHSNLEKLSSYVETLLQNKPVEYAAHAILPSTARSRTIFHTEAHPEVKNKTEDEHDIDVAIIGISCRFPGADNAESYWQNIRNGTVSISEIPVTRWDWRTHYDPEGIALDKSFSKWGGCIENVAGFDPEFFNLSPLEAQLMDPQQRLFLQEAWRAFEDGGYSAQQLDGLRCGVYLGVMHNEYSRMLERAGVTHHKALTMLGNSTSMMPSRISYHLNLKGPTLAIDTACSSSLVALHMACETLKRGETDMMLAGGVSLYLDSEAYIAMSQADMLSRDGRCFSFDDRANGFVPGDGVAAILLKRLDEAQADGDSIYAIIKGSGINHDGRSNGITAPSGTSQTALEKNIYEQTDINPETISYVEAHGTATPLGDPIEVDALSEAFFSWTDKKQFCAIGSVKSNIGHTSSAAGVAGVIKMLMAMKYRQLPPTANYDCANRHIDFEHSPFYVNTECKPWPTSETEARRATVSSFGFSGTNAHLILQEPPQTGLTRSVKRQYHPVVLSARNADALQEHMRNLLMWIQRRGDLQVDEHTLLASMAYTLSTGRSHMKCRFFCAVDSVVSLIEVLKNCISRPVHTSEDSSSYDVNEILKTAVHNAGRHEISFYNQLQQLGTEFCAGADIDWQVLYNNALYDGIRPLRLSLPTYPFSSVAHWFKTADGNMPGVEAYRAGSNRGDSRSQLGKESKFLHPLLQETTYTSEGTEFSSHFSGNEYFVEDHLVGAEKTLPGAVLLELARAAGSKAENKPVCRLRNNTFMKPVSLEQTCNLRVHIDREEGINRYRIVTDQEIPEVVAVGVLSYTSIVEKNNEGEQYSPKTIQSRCKNQLDGKRFYTICSERGLDYGERMRGLTRMDFSQDEVIAKLAVLDDASADISQWCLHPTLIDGALQSVAPLMLDDPRYPDRLYLPTNIGDLRIVDEHTRPLYVYASRVPGYSDARPSFSIKLLCEQGRTLIEINDYQLTPIKLRPSVAKISENAGFYLPQWNVSPLPVTETLPILQNECWVIFDNNRRRVDALQKAGSADVVWVEQGDVFCRLSSNHYKLGVDNPFHYEQLWKLLNADNKNVNSIFHNWCLQDYGFTNKHLGDYESVSIYSLWCIFRVMLRHSSTELPKFLFSYCDSHAYDFPGHPVFSAADAFLRVVREENPTSQCGSVAWLQPLLSDEEMAAYLLSELVQNEHSVAYREANRHVKSLVSMKAPSSLGASILRVSGFYAITGAMGYLGKMIATYLVTNYNARLLLIGRSPADSKIEEFIQGLEKLGGLAVYAQADVSKRDQIDKALSYGKPRYGVIQGVFHCAGTLRDSLIVNKTKTDIQHVLGAKVQGAINIDLATQQEPLDFFVLFSSVASVMGIAGQSDYGFANAFLDSFSHWRQAQHKKGSRNGRTLSLNWPLWQGDGMGVDKTTENWLGSQGVFPLPVSKGLQFLDQLLSMQYPSNDPAQVVVLYGDLDKLSGQLSDSVLIEKAFDDKESTASVGIQELEALLLELIQRETERDDLELSNELNFSTLGLESITIINLTRQLEQYFGRLPKTLFYEYGTVSDLACYLLKNHRYHASTENSNSSESTDGTVENVRNHEQGANQVMLPEDVNVEKIPSVTRQSQDIAIVGLAGRYPMADTVEKFWENIIAAKDCITEIPIQRWDIDNFYSENKRELGKSYSKWGGFIDDIDKFDPLFFNISPREAELMDPQERIFLETSAQVLEDAGYTKESLQHSCVGVFVGVMWGHYQLYGAEPGRAERGELPGSSYASVANRVSYTFDFNGPSVALDTMCSSSLSAIHLACQSIQTGDADVALAGGVNICSHRNKYLQLSQGKFVSSDGRCRAFGEGGDGYVPGEGCGAVLLKPLNQAVADGDHIYGVIKGTAINHGGRSNGYAVPNPRGQAEVVKRALKRARINSNELSYIEAHGTGTSLGDPIEISGLIHALGDDVLMNKKIAIGSVKSNIGHLESAAGIAGLSKILMQFKHGMLAPSLHAEKTNPNIDFELSPFYVQTQQQRWHSASTRYAALSSFGAGGANGHMVLSDYHHANFLGKEQNQTHNNCDTNPSHIGPYIFVLSARSTKVLERYASNMLHYITAQNTSERSSEKVNFSDENIEMGDKVELLSQLQTRLLTMLCQKINLNIDELDPEDPLSEYGIGLGDRADLSDQLQNEFNIGHDHRLWSGEFSLFQLAQYLFNTYTKELSYHFKQNTVVRDSNVQSLSFEETPDTVADIVFTLQVGREAMAERLAIIVDSIDDLHYSLGLFCNSNVDTGSQIFRGNAKHNKHDEALTDADIQQLLAQGNFEKVAKYWSEGGKVNWLGYCENKGYKRVSLPTYPFDRESHWISRDIAATPFEKSVSSVSISSPSTPNSLKRDNTMHINQKAPAPFGPFQPLQADMLQTARDLSLSDRKHHYIQAFIQHVCQKYQRCKAHTA